ncbi:F/Y-rich N-terminus-domain-containing protein [Absidia repens]|uniref:F/Y-rich N-terminus-domain-containing protein n=1 Tax=Absidia repens TaxID=90262 RepID=A0A1X2IW51_9FUNG|nr:F/Y-rich N-terminus-domain-containing protein [Absidia repens]
MSKPEVNLINRRDIKVKVFYSFQGSPTICLCSYRTSLAHGKSQSIVDIPLRTCLQNLCTSSPDILLQSDKDCAVYSAHFLSLANSGNGKDFIWEGHGLLSWILEEQFYANHSIDGKLYKHHVEVQLELHQTRRMSKSDYYDALTKCTMNPSENNHYHVPSLDRLSTHISHNSTALTSIPHTSSNEKEDTQLPPLLFHANANNIITKLPDSTRKRKCLMSGNTCPPSDPISASDNSNDDNHWSKLPRTTSPTLEFKAISAIFPLSPIAATLAPPSQASSSLSSSSSSPASLSSATTAAIVAAPPMSISSSSSAPNVLSTFTTTITTTNGRRKKRDTKPPNTSDVRTFTKVDQDKDGKYCLPVEIDSWTVYSLGYVVYDRPAFHNQRYIYPVGYKVKKWYRSMIDPKSDTQYVCEILDGGQEPVFRLEADDNPGKSYTGPTPTTVWTIAVREAFAIRNMDYGHNPVGPDFFGLRKNAIAKMIQDLPNADKCNNYIWQKFMAGNTSKPNKGRTPK